MPTWFRQLRATTVESRCSFRQRRGRPDGLACYRSRMNGSKQSDSNRFLRRSSMTGKSFWRLLLTPLLWGAAMFFFLLAGGSILRSLNAYDQWDLERIEWGEPPTSWPQRWRKKIGRTRFGLPGFASRKIPEIARKATPQTQASIHAESLKKPIQPVLPLFGSTIAADDDRPKERFASKEAKRIE